MATTNKNFIVKNGLTASDTITTSADISAGGTLKSTFSSGDEGGEIFLAKPATNSTISGAGVTIDIYQNKLRFFENGGDTRGFYIDITGGGNGVGTNLVGGGSASDSFRTISTPSGTSPVADSSTDTLTLLAGSNITITGDASTDSITFAATDTNTTYSVSAETTTGGANLRLTGSDASTDDVKIQGSGNIAVTRTDANTISVGPDYSLDYETTVASATVKVLTAASPRHQFFTGAASQTVNLPDTSTLKVGDWFVIYNRQTLHTVTIRTSNTSFIASANTLTTSRFVVVSTADNGASSWAFFFEGVGHGTTGVGAAVLASAPVLTSPTLSSPALTLSTTTSTTAGRLAYTGNTLRFGNGTTTLTFSDDTVALARANHTGTQTASTISDFDTQVRTSRLDQMAAPTASVSMNTQKITNLGTPTTDSDAATKAYVDAATSGLNVHDAVRVATTAAGGNINLSTGLVNGVVIDGITLVTGDRVLVKNQSTASQNGIYIVAASGAASRATDYDTTGEVDAGDFIFVESGSLNAKTGWVQVNKITTLGSDAIEFTQFSGAGTYKAGTGLTLTGDEFSLNAATSTALGGIELFSDTQQSVAANAVTTTASRTYGLQVNASGQGVVNVPWTDTVYTLPKATSTALGGIEIFSNTVQSVAANAVSSTASRTYGIQLNASDQAVVNVPWTDTNTTYSISAETITGGANLRLTGSDASTDNVKLQGSGIVTVTRTDADTITISATGGGESESISPLLLMGA